MRVLVVDDSAFVRRVIARALVGVPGVDAVVTAGSGGEALARLDEARPDVVTLDLDMPGMDGLAVLHALRARRPDLPIVILTVVARAAVAATLDALAGGAVDFLDKTSLRLMDLAALREELLGRLRAFAGRRVPPAAPAIASSDEPPALDPRRFDLCVIGASTGGPPALQAIVGDLAAAPPWPIVIAQHMPRGFSRPFATRLDALADVPVLEAVDGDALRPGRVLVAPAGQQTTVHPGGALRVGADAEGQPHAPSVDRLFESAAAAYPGRVLAVLLTGMGADGAGGLLRVREGGGVTIAESEASCVVFGMPRAAIRLGAAVHVWPLSTIRRVLADASRGRPS